MKTIDTVVLDIDIHELAAEIRDKYKYTLLTLILKTVLLLVGLSAVAVRNCYKYIEEQSLTEANTVDVMSVICIAAVCVIFAGLFIGWLLDFPELFSVYKVISESTTDKELLLKTLNNPSMSVVVDDVTCEFLKVYLTKTVELVEVNDNGEVVLSYKTPQGSLASIAMDSDVDVPEVMEDNGLRMVVTKDDVTVFNPTKLGAKTDIVFNTSTGISHP